METTEGVFLMFFWWIKRGITALLAGVIAVGICLLVSVASVGKFGAYAGERTYYLDSASSQGLQTSRLEGLDFLRVKGESVFIASDTQPHVQEIIKSYGASVVWTEQIDGVTSYYCYTPRWKETVVVNGRRVNLHIACVNGGFALGSPIIFGGY